MTPRRAVENADVLSIALESLAGGGGGKVEISGRGDG